MSWINNHVIPLICGEKKVSRKGAHVCQTAIVAVVGQKRSGPLGRRRLRKYGPHSTSLLSYQEQRELRSSLR